MAEHTHRQDPAWKRFDARFAVVTSPHHQIKHGGNTGVGSIVCDECSDRQVIVAVVSGVGIEASASLDPAVAEAMAMEILARVAALKSGLN